MRTTLLSLNSVLILHATGFFLWEYAKFDVLFLKMFFFLIVNHLKSIHIFFTYIQNKNYPTLPRQCVLMKKNFTRNQDLGWLLARSWLVGKFFFHMNTITTVVEISNAVGSWQKIFPTQARSQFSYATPQLFNKSIPHKLLLIHP